VAEWDADITLDGGSFARTGGMLIAPEELAARLDEFRVFDATVALDRPQPGGPYVPRPRREDYLAGHLPGAVFADLVEFSDPDSPFPFTLPSAARFAAVAGAHGIGTGVSVVVYSQTSVMWATRLWWLLRYFGFDDVAVLDGGLTAWQAAGLPVAAGFASYPAASFEARPRPELLATRADVEAIVGGGSACLVNTLDPRVFRGEGPTSYSRPGRIPGSVNVPTSGVVDPETQRLRPVPLPPGPLVFYCGGGISATVGVFTAALAGREDARLYDGSLTEWTADPSLPVEVG
jgi:thiosulfate/3-mercaptopyruvate sulfurtransferase